MAAKKVSKYYAVFQGYQPGVYTSWDEAALQVKGFKGARYKSFVCRLEAIHWLRECVLTASEAVDEGLIKLIKAQTETNDLAKTSRPGLDGEKIIIHTDGGASPNPGKGGYGIVLQQGKLRKELSAGYELTTNNRMEMMAVIVALEALQKASKVILHTDSKYVVDSISKGWAKRWRSRAWKKSDGKLAENVDLWEKLLSLLEKHKVDFRWVKGHAGNIENERCDVLANEAKKCPSLIIDTGYGKR
ncbi:MAG: ribonuclease HI [Candidatus Marinimicrobia bacterium]|nr:ribonuclease HI [Candidatus Neomarinimicrobiota bacterium]